MIVTFKQTTNDYLNAYKYISKKMNSRTRFGFLGTLISFTFGVLIVIGLVLIKEHYTKYGSIGDGELNKGLTVIAIGVGIYIIGAYIYTKKIQSLIFEKNGLYLSQQEFKIEKENLFHKMGSNKHYYKWKYVKEVEKTEGYVYIFIDNGVAIYIPLHAFKSDSECNSFYEALQNHMKS